MKSARKRAASVSIDKKRAQALTGLQRGLKIRFSDLSLLSLALTHRSYEGDQGPRGPNNERLEFLGDAVLGLVITEGLYLVRMDEREGYLAKCKAHLVSKKTLTLVSRTLGIDACLYIGKGEEMSGGRSNDAILSDALEALIGAYYLDSGYIRARAFVLRIFEGEIAKVLNDEHSGDYKTVLQEYAQRRFRSYPLYTVVKRSGPEHKQVFWTEVTIGEKTYGPAPGPNRKESEQEAAKIAYRHLTHARGPLLLSGEKSARSRGQGKGRGRSESGGRGRARARAPD